MEWLRSQGHDAIHLSDEELGKLPDREIFAKALTESRIILTFDLDFGEIATCARGSKVGVVVFRLHDTRMPHVLNRLKAVLPLCRAGLDRGINYRD